MTWQCALIYHNAGILRLRFWYKALVFRKTEADLDPQIDRCRLGGENGRLILSFRNGGQCRGNQQGMPLIARMPFTFPCSSMIASMTTTPERRACFARAGYSGSGPKSRRGGFLSPPTRTGTFGPTATGAGAAAHPSCASQRSAERLHLSSWNTAGYRGNCQSLVWRRSEPLGIIATAFGMKEGAVSFPGVKDFTGVVRAGRVAAVEISGGGGGRRASWEEQETSDSVSGNRDHVCNKAAKSTGGERMTKWTPIATPQSRGLRRCREEVSSSMASVKTLMQRLDFWWRQYDMRTFSARAVSTGPRLWCIGRLFQDDFGNTLRAARSGFAERELICGFVSTWALP